MIIVKNMILLFTAIRIYCAFVLYNRTVLRIFLQSTSKFKELLGDQHENNAVIR